MMGAVIFTMIAIVYDVRWTRLGNLVSVLCIE